MGKVEDNAVNKCDMTGELAKKCRRIFLGLKLGLRTVIPMALGRFKYDFFSFVACVTVMRRSYQE